MCFSVIDLTAYQCGLVGVGTGTNEATATADSCDGGDVAHSFQLPPQDMADSRAAREQALWRNEAQEKMELNFKS